MAFYKYRSSSLLLLLVALMLLASSGVEGSGRPNRKPSSRRGNRPTGRRGGRPTRGGGNRRLRCPASAPDVQKCGFCTSSSSKSDWKLKLSPENNGTLEIEAEIETHRSGQRWVITAKRGGKTLFRLTRTTQGPDGKIEVRQVVQGQNGKVSLIATRKNSNEKCQGAATFN